VFDWFKKKKAPLVPGIVTDVHSHLLAGIDDGVKTLEQAEEIILHFQLLGYQKLITTPHVISDTYKNTPEGILQKLNELNTYLKRRHIDITVEAAAEYYLDEQLLEKVDKERLLTFGKERYLLFETNFMTEPFNLKEFVFRATTKGYKPVLAHPERYMYLQNNLSKVEDLLNRGVLLQLNISSITGYYSKPAHVMAQKLIDQKWIHMLGSDCHHLQHVQLVDKAQYLKYYEKALSLPLLNNSL
jgi:tyrosine-protein phosphatase YwqE